jgi:protein MBA1
LASPRKDVIIPHPVLSHFRQVGLSGLWSRFRDNRWNAVKSMLGLYTLASGDAIPGVITAGDPWYTKWFLWPFYASTTQSTSPKSWLTTSRQLVLDTYKNLNTAVAKCVHPSCSTSYANEIIESGATSQKSNV